MDGHQGKMERVKIEVTMWRLHKTHTFQTETSWNGDEIWVGAGEESGQFCILNARPTRK